MPEMKALIFDQDGVIGDTERDGHRVAFNRVFAEEGLDVVWDVPRYGELLKIAGGKERMKTVVYADDFTKDVGDKEEFIKKLHKRKTDIFMEIISKGEIALRSGIKRLVTEAHEAGLKLAVCSTSNERAVNMLVCTLLGDEAYGWFDVILAGDVVKQKKPSPVDRNWKFCVFCYFFQPVKRDFRFTLVYPVCRSYGRGKNVYVRFPDELQRLVGVGQVRVLFADENIVFHADDRP